MSGVLGHGSPGDSAEPFTLASLLFNSRATGTEFLETIVLFLVFSGGVIVLWLIPILWAGLLISVVSKAVRKISAALREGTTYEDFWFFLVYNRPVDKGLHVPVRAG